MLCASSQNEWPLDVVQLLSRLDTTLQLVLRVVVSILLMVAGKSILPTGTLG